MSPRTTYATAWKAPPAIAARRPPDAMEAPAQAAHGPPQARGEAFADIDAAALAERDAVMKMLLSKDGNLTAALRRLIPHGHRPRTGYRFHWDSDTPGKWTSVHGDPRPRGVGMVALVALISKSTPDRAAEVLAVILAKVAEQNRPLTPTVINDYPQLRQVLASRRKQLGMSQLETDWQAGLQDGYVGKIEAGIKNLGNVSLSSLLSALKVEMIIQPIEQQ